MAYQQALRRAAPLLTVLVQACPMLVPLAEEGLLAHPAARLFVEEYVRPMLLQRVSALVLGCTHYPLFVPLLREICGASVAIVDSANSVALAVANILDKAGLRSQANQPAGDALVLCATDVTQRLRRVAADFLGGPVPDVHLVDL